MDAALTPGPSPEFAGEGSTPLLRRAYGRRAFLALSGGVGASGFLAACGSGGGDQADVKIRYSTPGSLQLLAGATAIATSTPIPPPEVIVSTTTPNQGGTMLVSVVGSISGGAITFLERTYPLTKGQNSLYAFVGVDVDDPPGQHPLKVDFTLMTGSQGSTTEAITVLPTGWTVDAVTLGPSQTNLLDPKLAEQELAEVKRVYGTRSAEKLWSRNWQLPIDGPITTRFGEQRSYNGAAANGHHGGADIGADLGTPVGACNTGRVIMARQLAIRGNMVIVDHGGGLMSGYAHLGEFSVAQGQLVGPGDTIGLVGSTGLSTGAHLHWEMATGTVLVDALRFLDGSNGF